MQTKPAKTHSLIRSVQLFALWFCTFIALSLAPSVFAQETDFPALTGRVVDMAGLLDDQSEAQLTATLAAHEAQTSNQIVVVTVPSLNGYDIFDYSNRLGRHWEIGTSEEDNGILLVVAPNERKVRIEVGYGLEGALTDSLSSIIIQREILPEFKKNNYPNGIMQGVTAITQAVEGEYTAPAKGRKSDAFSEKFGNYIPLLFIAIVGITELLKRTGNRKASTSAFTAGFGGLFALLASSNLFIALGVAAALFLFVYFKGSGGDGSNGPRSDDHVRGGGFGGSGGFGGGFSGGGGGFGGGGASGSW